MFDWDWSIPSWRHRLIHFFLCNNPLFDGCSGHPYKEDV